MIYNNNRKIIKDVDIKNSTQQGSRGLVFKSVGTGLSPASLKFVYVLNHNLLYILLGYLSKPYEVINMCKFSTNLTKVDHCGTAAVCVRNSSILMYGGW